MTLRQAVQRSVPLTRMPTVAVRQSTAFETLRIRDFRYLCLSNGLAMMSLRMFPMVIGWLVLEMTNSKLWVGGATGVPAIAVIFFCLAGGVLTDRTDPKIILSRVRMVLAGLTFLIAFLVTAL